VVALRYDRPGEKAAEPKRKDSMRPAAGPATRRAASEPSESRDEEPAEAKASVRVRIKDSHATLTIKSRAPERRRLELEYPIPVLEAEAAIALGIGESTAKTHLQNVFFKTGVSRQVDLIILLHRLIPSARRPN